MAFKTALRLQHIIQPYLLRRRKSDASVALILPEKKEQVLFCRLSAVQRGLYETLINSPEVERAIRFRRPLFGMITTLRKLCNHPMMAFHKGRISWQHEEAESGGEADGAEARHREPALVQVAKEYTYAASDIKWEDSGKLFVLSRILPLWRQAGHKVLLFSQTQSMLNICEALMRQQRFPYLRLDGSTPVGQRERLIDTFNSKDSDIFVFLLTTKAGGLGISLTGANRVIILDPCWNPQTDIQARERAWRIGQEREVTVYRLITKGTIEEKIYKRQISKILLSEKILLNARQQRMPFSKSEVKDIFELGDDDCDGSAGLFPFSEGGEGRSLGDGVQFDIAEDQLGAVDPAARGSSVILADGAASALEPGELAPAPRPGAPASSPGTGSGAAASGRAEGRPRPPPPGDAALTAEQKVERRLVTSLFNGERISGVFDYDSALNEYSGDSNRNMFSGGGSSGPGSVSRSHPPAGPVGEFSGAASQQMLSHLKTLNASMTATDGGAPSGLGSRDKEKRYTVSDDIVGQRTGRTMQFIAGVAEPARDAAAILGTPASVVPRLRAMFAKPGARYSTNTLLEKFSDLGDQYAQLFRELLRTVAAFDSASKMWLKKD